MTPVPPAALSVPVVSGSGSGADPVQVLTRRLAAAGFGVHATRHGERHELAIVNLTAARSGFTLTSNGRARWGYEPDAGHGTGAVHLADDGYLDWECDYRTALHGNPSPMADVVVPILRARPRGIPRQAG